MWVFKLKIEKFYNVEESKYFGEKRENHFKVFPARNCRGDFVKVGAYFESEGEGGPGVLCIYPPS